VIAAEQLVSDHHRRQLENRAADQKAEAMREVLGTFLQLAPTAVNKLAGRAVLPEKTSPALVGLRALVGTLKAEQLEAFKFVLSPAQLVGSDVVDGGILATITKTAEGGPQLLSVIGPSFVPLTVPALIKITAANDNAAVSFRIRSKTVTLRPA
jgi:hypothetical protein